MSYADFQRSYQICPIVLMEGVAGTGVLPITQLLKPSGGISLRTQIRNTVQTAVNQIPILGGFFGTDFTFGSFRVLAGGSLIENEVAKYPLATMATAANAIITNPLRISVEMATPASADVSMSQRLSVFTTLKSVLDNHIAQGGYFNVATPAYVYTNCLLLDLTDASDVPDGAQTQVRWIWNFEKPLITLQQAQTAANNAMSKVTGQTYNAGQPPGAEPLKTSVSNPSIGQQITPGSDNAAGVTQSSPGASIGLGKLL